MGNELVGDLKQDIIRCYNLINQRLFNVGTKWVKVEFTGCFIFILAKHRRVAGNAIIDRKMPIMSRMIDVVLLDEFKENLITELSLQFNFDIQCIFKDYDPQTELSGTLIVLNNPL